MKFKSWDFIEWACLYSSENGAFYGILLEFPPSIYGKSSLVTVNLTKAFFRIMPDVFSSLCFSQGEIRDGGNFNLQLTRYWMFAVLWCTVSMEWHNHLFPKMPNKFTHCSPWWEIWGICQMIITSLVWMLMHTVNIILQIIFSWLWPAMSL